MSRRDGRLRREGFTRANTLDLCCGDGSYSFLFYSDIAGHVDAVDNDPHAIAYAAKYRASPIITYHQLDIIKQSLPETRYDVIVWNAAICYFSEDEIALILRKIADAGEPTMQLSGMLPRANGHVDHKTEFSDRASVAALLRRYFGIVEVREIDEGSLITFYFRASDPLVQCSPSTT
jgi:SAM-dependent methyltransferase